VISAPPPNSSTDRARIPRGPKKGRFALAALLALAAGIGAPRLAHAVLPTYFYDDMLVGGLDTPVNSTQMPDGRILFVEQYSARVRMIVNDAIAATDPVGTVPEIRAAAEAGLIGIATDPNWPARPYVYVMGNHSLTQTVRLWRFKLQGDLTRTGNGAMSFVPNSRYTILADIPDLTNSHQAGSLRFGNDGMLYVMMGDDTQGCPAQDPTSRLGKILRIRISTLADGPGGPPRYSQITPPDNPYAASPDSVARIVWAKGLRNPYMTTYDSATNSFIIGDVGNEAWEEIDVVSTGGRNFGWPMWEGPARTGIVCAGADTSTLTAPVYSYPHDGPGYAVFAGPIYRAPVGAAHPYPTMYEGRAFLGDTWKGFLRQLVKVGANWQLADSVAGQPNKTDWATPPRYITSMHVGADGSLYYFLIYRTVPTSGPGELHRIRYVGPSIGVDDPPDDSDGAGEDARPTLAAPWPVPGAGPVEFAYRLPRPSSVRLAIFDARGRQVRLLADAGSGVRPAGAFRATWDGRDASGAPAPAGMYFARLDAGGVHVARRFVRWTAAGP
jgi:glucose/arabinose dehydrogenase